MRPDDLHLNRSVVIAIKMLYHPHVQTLNITNFTLLMEDVSICDDMHIIINFRSSK